MSGQRKGNGKGFGKTVATGSKEVGIPGEVGQKGPNRMERARKEGLCSPPLWRVLVSGELRKLWRKKMGAVHGTNPNSPHHRHPGPCARHLPDVLFPWASSAAHL